MKFTCDSCGAAYMISDDKVGPGGVKVRCKKCGNVVTVRRAEEPPVVAPAAAPAAPPAGLDDELGNAFDHAFGGASAAPPAAPVPAPVPAPPATLAPAPAAAPSPPATEWYVAIGEAQVGPLPLADVRSRWEAGEVGPDSLVWRPGMADWEPLSGVADLAAYLSPVPQPARPEPAQAAAVTAVPPAAAPSPSRFAAAGAGHPAAGAPAPAAPAPSPEVDWKPSGASALAAMASEEMATRDAAAAPATPRPAPARSIMDQLPDGGGVDPTGAVPLPIKGMEPTGERPARRSSVARGAEELRHKRTVRTTVLAVVGLIVVAAAAAGAYAVFVRREAPPPAPALAVTAAPPAPPPAAPPAAPPSAPPQAAAPTVEPPAAAGATGPTAATAATTTAAPAAATPPKAEPSPEAVKAPVPAREPPRIAAKPAAPRPPPRVAAAAKPAPAHAQGAAERPAAQAKKKDSVLDFDQGAEDDLAAALGGSGRPVYVPPRPGGATAPDRLTDAQITEVVRGRVDDLRGCAARSPAGKGTLKVAWTILPDGTPKDVRSLTPELANSEFSRCITGVVKGLRFPRLADPKGQPVTFPFGY